MNYYLFFLFLILLNSCNTKGNVSENNNLLNITNTVINNISNITADKLYNLINSKKDNDIIIIDIRTFQEYITGHISNSINIDFYSDSFEEEISKLEKNKIYVIYCRSGNRSYRSLDILKKYPFKMIYNLENGINEWILKGYPVVTN